MAKLLKMPALGQTVEEVRILQWYKNEGDPVVKGERLAEIETDKVNIDWESPDEGVVRRILAPVDSFVKVEAPVLIVGTADESIDDLMPGGEAALSPPAPFGGAIPGGANTPSTSSTPNTRSNESLAPAGSAPPKGAGGDKAATAAMTASPRARRVADEFGVSVTELAGRGSAPGGRIVERDVKAYHEELLVGAAFAAEAA
ncbi:MAG: E3 binding domain-containing protein, partial [Cytophagales bacterium]|nr:E3 binding domain-containing protein [Armatimonadota bacterium]